MESFDQSSSVVAADEQTLSAEISNSNSAPKILSTATANSSEPEQNRGGGAAAPPKNQPGLESASTSAVRASQGDAGRPTSVVPPTFLSTFNFGNPFVSATASSGEQEHSKLGGFSRSSNLPTASPDSQSGIDNRVESSSFEKFISIMTAEELYNSLVGKHSCLDRAVWIREDVSGLAIINFVAPSDLGDFLLTVIKDSSIFIRGRVIQTLLAMIERDTTIPSEIKNPWMTFKASAVSAVKFTPASPATPAPMPHVLFPSTPSHTSGSSGVALSTPAFLANYQSPKTEQRSSTPSFLSEVPTRAACPLMNSPLFGDSTAARASVVPLGSPSNSPFGNFSITINQPAAEPPKWVILETISDSALFYSWLKKNRKEMLMARPVDCKRLNELVGQYVREEVSRIIVAAQRFGPSANFFTEDCPYPANGWSDVCDKLLLKILFGFHGPRNAEAAIAILTSRQFFWNDATRYQDQFTAEVRKFCNGFQTTLSDFSFNYSQWPPNDDLSRDMIRDAFTKCFAANETVKGKDGTTLVPKCSNLPVIRDIIRQKKGLALEEIINHITDHFERIDIAIRSSKGLAYNIVPWNVQARKQPFTKQARNPRNFNAVAAHGGGAQAQLPPRPPPQFPRCCNCGSKAHKGDERHCYLWGHPKGKGAEGVWPENGGPSLRLNPKEWKEWATVRHAQFYSYSENAGKKRPAPDTST